MGEEFNIVEQFCLYLSLSFISLNVYDDKRKMLTGSSFAVDDEMLIL
jgi:hypothetical protein